MAKPRKPEASGSGRLAAPRPASDDTNTLKPHFSLELLVQDRVFNLTNCTQEQQAAFALGLRDRSSSTWADIIRMPRDGLGFEKIHSLNVSIPPTVPVDKRERIVAFRIGALARFLGFRDGRVFYVVWIDPAGKAYDHG